jgi:hypothetical protein
MLDLPGHPPLDKTGLIGTCSRLPLRVERERLQAEVAALPEGTWGSAGGRVGVHRAAQAVFLRGFAPAEGDKPIEDREPLAHLPYVREIITRLIPANAQRCLLARLPPDTKVAGHIDRAPYFSKTIRIHLPVTTNENVWMYSAGFLYRMRPGEVWALNNSAAHGVWNADLIEARTHLICDFLLSDPLAALLANAERSLGVANPEIERALQQVQ